MRDEVVGSSVSPADVDGMPVGGTTAAILRWAESAPEGRRWTYTEAWFVVNKGYRCSRDTFTRAARHPALARYRCVVDGRTYLAAEITAAWRRGDIDEAEADRRCAEKAGGAA